MKMLLPLAALVVLGASALAGTFRCENLCPLAAQANGMRSFGGEAVATSAVVLADLGATVAGNLDRV